MEDESPEQLEENNQTVDADASLDTKTSKAVRRPRQKKAGMPAGKKTRVKRNLSRLPDMPLDILFEVSVYIHGRSNDGSHSYV